MLHVAPATPIFELAGNAECADRPDRPAASRVVAPAPPGVPFYVAAPAFNGIPSTLPDETRLLRDGGAFGVPGNYDGARARVAHIRWCTSARLPGRLLWRARCCSGPNDRG